MSKGNNKKHNKNTIAPGNTISDSEAYQKTVEIREKRINIVFKVIYVDAIFFAAIFLEIVKSFEKGLTSTYIMEACIAAFLLVMLGYMISYIFNEMKCMKLVAADLSKDQMHKTEESYSRIFTHLIVAGLSSFVIGALGIYFAEHFTQKFLYGMFVLPFFPWAVCFFCLYSPKIKDKDILHGILCVLVTTALISFFWINAFLATQT